MSRKICYGEGYGSNAAAHEATAFDYRADGSGRDSYIIKVLYNYLIRV